MPENDKFFSVNIREYLALGNDEEAGEPALLELLSGFSCPKNPDVERFLKKSAIEFKEEPIRYISCSFGRRCPAAWVLYSCIKAADSKGRNSKQYHEKKAIAY